MTELADQLPPQSLEAEQAVLGAMMLERDAIAAAGAILEPGDFYREPHGTLFRTITEMAERGEPADNVTLGQRLRDLGELDRVGGMAYLTTLLDAVATAANVERYARTVADRAARRRLIAACHDTIAAAHMVGVDIESVFGDVQTRIDAFAARVSAQPTRMIGDVAAEVFARMEAVQASGREVMGLRSGFPRLDRLYGGFEAGSLMVVAAFTSQGKTCLGLNLMAGIARQEKVATLVMSIEQPPFQIGVKAVAGETGIEPWRLRAARLDSDEWGSVADAAQRLRGLPVYVRDASGMTVERLTQAVRHEVQRHEVRAVLVDHLQLLGTARRIDDRGKQLGYVADRLAQMARVCRVPVVTIAQISREAHERTMWREGGEPVAPEITAVKYSGDVENAVDMLCTLNHEVGEGEQKTGRAVLAVRKNRMGVAPVQIELVWDDHRQRFAEAAERDDAPPEPAVWHQQL